MLDMVRWEIYRNNVFLPSRRVFGDLAPALLVHTFVYTIVVDDHENDWEIVPKERYILHHTRRIQSFKEDSAQFVFYIENFYLS